MCECYPKFLGMFLLSLTSEYSPMSEENTFPLLWKVSFAFWDDTKIDKHAGRGSNSTLQQARKKWGEGEREREREGETEVLRRFELLQKRKIQIYICLLLTLICPQFHTSTSAMLLAARAAVISSQHHTQIRFFSNNLFCWRYVLFRIKNLEKLEIKIHIYGHMRHIDR